MIATLAALGGMMLGLVVGAVAMREWLHASAVVSAACDDMPTGAEVFPTDDGPTYAIRFAGDMSEEEIAEFRRRFRAAQRPSGDGWGDAAELVGPRDAGGIVPGPVELRFQPGEVVHPRESYDERYSAEAADLLDIPLHDYHPANPGNAQYPRRNKC